jgi:acyl-CoA synthetase (NDP forming)
MNKVQMEFKQCKELLGSYGISLQGQIVTELDDALQVADELGYPVVLKALSSQIIHKTDVDVVFLEVIDRDAVRKTYSQIIKNTEQAGIENIAGILVQTMAKTGFELFIGAKQDPSFGPVTMVGHGGRFVELFADAAPGIGILEREDVLIMLSKTMAGRILDGFRGPRLDKGSVIDLTLRVSRLMAEHPEIHELDLNPVIVHEQGVSVVDSHLIQGDPIIYPRHTDLSKEQMKSLNSIFNPGSVAIVGASRSGTMGGIILKNCKRIKKIFPINPRLKTVQGMRCYRSLSDLPEVPDVGVFAINSEATVSHFEEFCQMGGKGAIIFSDGFAEMGRHDLEDRLVRISREHNVVYIGPNCMGVIDNYSGLNTLFIPEQRTGTITEPNGIGFISQSGGVGLELLEMLEADNLDLGKWVSCGNASSVGVPEILAHMGEDPRIKVIAIYLEGLADGLKLMEIGKKVTRNKPVLVIKGGVAGGAAATLSHTASLAGSHEAFKACCQQAGFYLIEELTEDPKILVNVLSILMRQLRAQGNRVAVVSVGGGAGILVADQVTEEGMQLAEFAPETKDKLRTLMESDIRTAKPENIEDILQGIGANPLDLRGNSDDDRLLEALRIIDSDRNTDIILAAIYLQVPFLSEFLPERLADLKNELTKPLIVSPRGFSEYVSRCREYLYSKKFRTYTVRMIKPIGIALKI